MKAEGTSRVTWEIRAGRGLLPWTVTHDELREGPNNQLYGGWPMVLTGPKTRLEMGITRDDPDTEPRSTRRAAHPPGSLMYR